MDNPLILRTLLDPAKPLRLASALDPSFFGQLRDDWHEAVVVMVRDRLPKVVVILVILLILERVIGISVRRMQRLAARSAVAGRGAQLRTMATIVRATSYSILAFLAFLQILNLLAIPYQGLLASAGIVGVGIGLAAQSLFKDIINGIFILIEDQYNVGEVIKIASLTGTVEDLTLRLTRLRDGDGTLYIIPNSQVAVVSNLSRDYALANLTLTVDVSANPNLVLATLKQMAQQIRSEPAFQDIFLSDPEVVGVDRIDGRSIQYPILFRVRPQQKDEVLRELRRRVILTFESHGIPFGIDPSMLLTHPDPTATPAQQPLINP